MNTKNIFFCIVLLILINMSCSTSKKTRIILNFNDDWQFTLQTSGSENSDKVTDWKPVTLPHDWSIEGKFSKDNPATPGGGALPGGIGWYRKEFKVPSKWKGKEVSVEFDGIYQNSEVWINRHYLGKRPNGYISFLYELTDYINYNDSLNVITVKVDNSLQPNSRWYSGSGIYRNVRLVITDKIHIDHWGTFITTPRIDSSEAIVKIQTGVVNSSDNKKKIKLITTIYGPGDEKLVSEETDGIVSAFSKINCLQKLAVVRPSLWSDVNPELYKVVQKLEYNRKPVDLCETTFGIRYFRFDSLRGFSLNGKPTKINGVCLHHDLGCLGTAVNTRAIERQLELLKLMGCNGIRTSHNPPAPELLDLCDKMGFIVMDEAFDMWKKGKTTYDYHLYFDEWHQRDLEDMVLRDRNHPSVMIWSIGNEILEQWDSTGITLTSELTGIVKKLDDTRPVTSGLNDPNPWNYIFRSGRLDLVGFNYHRSLWPDFPKNFPGQKFIASETVSGLATRGCYDMPSDSIRRWPARWDIPFTDGNADYSCSSYDNCCAPWGSTHEETWKIMKNYDYLSGMFVWTGWDYLGEPTPYSWPARSSYFGIIDLAGFPKDIYYFYQSEWTNRPVLHILPHWNWNNGDTIDVWVYTNYSEVELYLNGRSLGIKDKTDDDFHLMWSVPFQPGTLKAIARKARRESLIEQVNTAGEPAAISLVADRNKIHADGKDLSFVTVNIVDSEGNLVPLADNLVNFSVSGNGIIAGVDNGSQISHEPFKANYRKAFHGKCLVVVRSSDKKGRILVKASSDRLKADSVVIQTK